MTKTRSLCSIVIPYIYGAVFALANVSALQAANLVERLDRNGDGGLSLDEIPPQMTRLRKAFDIVDANHDGMISGAEFEAISARRPAGRGDGATSRPAPTTPQTPAPAGPSVTGKGSEAIDARLRYAIDNNELPGAVVVFIKNGETVFEHVYGYADIEKQRPQRIDDLFNLGSTSKPLAMTAIMTQVAEGKLSLDDPMSKWIPAYANKKLADGSRAKRSPVVREMMSHTSGTFAGKCGERRDMSLLYMFRRTLKESAEAISKKPLVYQPGEDFCYGGPAMQVLSRTVEEITGREFDELAVERVFDPLAMNDTFYRTGKNLEERIAVIYERSGNRLVRSRRTRNPRNDPFILAPGGVFSTAEDLSRFVEMHLRNGELDGRRVLSEKLTKEMRRNQIGDNETDFGDPLVGDRNTAALGKIEGYGLGWILDELRDDGSARLFSHGGAWGTYIWGDMDAQLGAVLLTQTPLGNATPVWNDVLNIARATWSDASNAQQTGSGWKPDVKQMGNPGQQYIDPEILPAEGLITFQDTSGNIWVDSLDTETGLFASADGRHTLMADDALNVRQTYNGPEFGLDREGWAVFFSRPVDGVSQVWRASLVDGKPRADPLLNDSQRRQTPLASKNPQAPSTRVLYLQGKLGDGDFFWSDENRPESEHAITRLKEVDSPRWIDNSDKLVYVESDGVDAGQVKLADTATGKVSTITNDKGIKSFAYGWNAPDYNNELLVLALVDYKKIGVWRDTGNKYWQRIATLEAPRGSRYRYFGSPEPFTYKEKSFISLVLKDSNTRGRFADSEVWILGVDESHGERFARRVDDGRSPVMRSDPEVFTGSSEVFVYYNALDEDKKYEIHRARTGLLLDGRIKAAEAVTDVSAEFDCARSPQCVEIRVKGAPAATLSDGTPSMFRGMVDASVLSDPQSGKIYLAYTAVSSHDPSATAGRKLDIAPGIALASSNDKGRSWTYEGAIKPSVEESDPVTGRAGYASQEVSSLARGGDYWYMAYLRFHDPQGGGNNRKRDSFHLEVARAKSIDALATAKVTRYAGNLAADAWYDYRLSDLDAELSGCSLWLDPELYYEDSKLYMLSVCIPYDAGQRITQKSFYAVFELGNTSKDFGKPHYLGKLADAEDAERFGANELSKADIARSQDGSLLFLTAPVFKGARFEEYPGCYVLEVESINPPRLKRDKQGKPVVRAVIKSSASVPTSASCAYDPGLNTGVLLTHREMLPAQRKLEWSLYATGVHP